MTDNNDLWNLDRQDYVAIVTSLRADLTEARAELEQEPTATLRQQLRGSQSALSKVMGELTEARESATRRSTEYAKVQAELYQKIEAEQAQTREAYRQRDAARQDEAEARADVQRFEAALDAANRELAQAQHAATGFALEIAACHALVNEAERQRNHARNDTARWKQECADQFEELQALKSGEEYRRIYALASNRWETIRRLVVACRAMDVAGFMKMGHDRWYAIVRQWVRDIERIRSEDAKQAKQSGQQAGE